MTKERQDISLAMHLPRRHTDALLPKSSLPAVPINSSGSLLPVFAALPFISLSPGPGYISTGPVLAALHMEICQHASLSLSASLVRLTVEALKAGKGQSKDQMWPGGSRRPRHALQVKAIGHGWDIYTLSHV